MLHSLLKVHEKWVVEPLAVEVDCTKQIFLFFFLLGRSEKGVLYFINSFINIK